MKKIVFLLIPIILALTSSIIFAGSQKIKIVTTTSDIASIAKAVSADEADVTNLCTGIEDPHFLQAKPSFIIKARDADLWIAVGMDLEIGWEPKILESARNPEIQRGQKGYLDLSKNIIPLDVPTEKITRAMGEVY